jgi:hypothetical protein
VPRGHRGDRTGESHSISEDVACRRRLVQKVGEARRLLERTVAMTRRAALSWGPEAAAKAEPTKGGRKGEGEGGGG